MWDLSYDCTMTQRPEKEQDEKSLSLFARNLKENASRYEEEALKLLQEGVFRKIIDGVTVVHFLRDGGSGYQISNQSPEAPEEIFFQVLDEDPAYRLKLLIDQMAHSEVDASFLIKN
jgi:hypothetical protein